MTTETSERTMQQQVHVSRERAADVVRRGSLTGALGGVAVVALSILGLVGIMPASLLAVAAIVLGAAYVIESSSFAVEYPKLFTREDEPTEVAEVGSSAGSQFAVGIAGIVLGIVSVAGFVPGVLLPALAVMFGAGLILASMGPMRVRHLGMQATVSGITGHNPRSEAVTLAAWVTTLGGLAAIVLGVIALVAGPVVGLAITQLALIAFLVLGAVTLLNSGVVARQLVHLYHPEPAS